MNRHSLFFKLNLFFLFTVAALIAFFVMTVREFEAQELHLIEKKVLHDEAEIRKIILEEVGDPEKRFKARGYRVIEYPETIKSDLKQIFRHPPSSFPLIVSERILDGRLKIYRDSDNLYFELIGPDHSTMIASPMDVYRPKWIPFLFGSMMAILILLYWTMLRSLKPLKTLAEQIRRFGEGNMDVSTKSEKRDEIAFVANQFDAAAKKIRAMKEARTLFMRNIMHELKTPITKGKLSVALMNGGEEEEVLRRAFERMEQLIQEMAEVEMITSQSLDLNPDVCDLKTMVNDVSTLLFIENDRRVQFVCHPCKVIADCKTLTIVIKNLIDNGLKYSPDNSVEICCKKGVIQVINKGEPLPKNFEEIIEPFAKGEPNHSEDSFGLGLYIVKSILDAHGAELDYRYEGGRHIFSIRGLKPAK
ncbi:ArsS family sensor histidine kinase [Hydrogenimonas urashimensis]|uniref:ArsS family sensor histidine kinase n=1 Tax=Hydrogenimonas urashimensis TaxID=2740515 RepID=UPI001916765E|nr:ArsS family sensor histidine kinase [Hydrogenimonas urashimensis]